MAHDLVFLNIPDFTTTISTQGGKPLTGKQRRASKRATTDDRLWFADHPTRSHRLRAAIADELPGVKTGEWVVVRQLKPGYRMRWPFTPPPELPPPPDEEALAHAIFNALQAHPPGGFCPLHEIQAQWRALQQPGRA